MIYLTFKPKNIVYFGKIPYDTLPIICTLALPPDKYTFEGGKCLEKISLRAKATYNLPCYPPLKNKVTERQFHFLAVQGFLAHPINYGITPSTLRPIRANMTNYSHSTYQLFLFQQVS